MIPLHIDIVLIIGGYFILSKISQFYHTITTHSVTIRILSGLVAWALVIGLLDYVLTIFLLMISAATDKPESLLAVFFLVLITGIMLRFIIIRPDTSSFNDVRHLVRESLVFAGYHRLRDAETRAQIERERLSRIHKEISHGNFDADLTALSQDFQHHPETASRPIRMASTGYVPPTYHDEKKSLLHGELTDVSSAFCFELAKTSSHPYLSHMKNFSIDPRQRLLSFDIHFPPEREMDMHNNTFRMNVLENLYVALQILISMDWFSLYAPFVATLDCHCKQNKFDDNGLIIEEVILGYTIPLKTLRSRGDTITPHSEIIKIGTVIT